MTSGGPLGDVVADADELGFGSLPGSGRSKRSARHTVTADALSWTRFGFSTHGSLGAVRKVTSLVGRPRTSWARPAMSLRPPKSVVSDLVAAARKL